MTNAELLAKIKAEIESLKSIEYPCDNSQQATGFFNALDRMTDFLSTLESEKPVHADLEEAARDFADNARKGLFAKDYAISSIADYDHGCIDGFIAGAKWQKEQMISALKNDGDLPIEFIDKFHEIDRTAFQNGQANMKEQMMKEAIHYVVQDDLDSHGVSYNIPFIRIGTTALKPKGIGVGDKVRIIVIPNTDKK